MHGVIRNRIIGAILLQLDDSIVLNSLQWWNWQHCSNVTAMMTEQCCVTTLLITLFMLASSTLFKPVNRQAVTMLWVSIRVYAAHYTRKNITGYCRAVDLSCGSNNVVQVCSFKQAMNCLFQHAWTMFKPVNNHVQARQLNHVQVCQQPRSSWPAQRCSRLPIGKNKLCGFTCVGIYFNLIYPTITTNSN